MATSDPALHMIDEEKRQSTRAGSASGPPRPYFAVAALLVALFALAFLSQAKVQVTDRGAITERAESVWMLARTKQTQPERGTIYSSDERILAQSNPKYDFWVFFDKVPCTHGFFSALAEAAGISESRISAPFGEGRKRVWLEPLDSEKYARAMSVKREWGADGVSLEEQKDRVYPLGASAVGVIGWLHEGKPRSGIERSLERDLLGASDAQKPLSASAAKGADVVLTIDSQLQLVAANAIRTAVEQHKAVSGSAIVIVPKTGDILAMADWPAFDPAKGPNGASERATSTMEDLQPGSTFKVLTLAKALDKGVVPDNSTISCAGVLDLGGNRTVKCDLHNGSRAHGVTNLERAIGKSCNVSAARWALKVGRDDMIAFVRDLGLLSKPDLGLKGVAAPLFDMNEWDKERQVATLGFGQSIAVPPVSLAAALAMLANDGEYVAPRLVDRIGPNKRGYATPKRVVSKESAKTVRKYMESVVQTDWGTGKTLRIPGQVIAGKTGTAQKLGSGGGNVSSFVGMFPADAPRVLILVMVNDPRGGEFYGSLVAGPAFDDIAYAAIERLNIPRSEPAPATKSGEQ